MKAILLGTVVLVSSAIGTAAYADGMFWVVGNRAGNTCDIVTRNPVIDGNIWFGDGPYRSLSDANLARSTIRTCQPVPEPTPVEQSTQAGEPAGPAAAPAQQQ